MRTNRLYRVSNGTGKTHLARSTADAALPPRALCGTRLRHSVETVELRGDFGRAGDCGRCDRVFSP